MTSAVSIAITTLTIPQTFTPADSCTAQNFKLDPLGPDHLEVNSTTRVGHGYTAIYTTTVVTRGIVTECYPTQYDLLGKTIQPNATASMGIATYIVDSYAAQSCPPAFVAHIGEPTSAAAAVTTCCPTGMDVISTTGPIQSPYLCSQTNEGPVTIDFGSSTTVIPAETHFGIVAAAVFIVPRDIDQSVSGTSEGIRIALGVGFAAFGALALGAVVVGLFWWRRRKSRSTGTTGRRARDGFELLG